jgi:5-formyltetrahydrofolate cyclo-ligase
MTRTEAKRLRDELSQEALSVLSGKIACHLIAWPAFERALSVMAYVSIGSEVGTENLLHAIFSSEKRLYLPRCGENGSMDAVAVSDLSSLVPGRFSIPEPEPSLPATKKHEIDLILTPGLLFDRTGARLGRGGGYYDRFLRDYRGMTCGLAFSIQIVQKLTCKAHDVGVLALVTEHGIIRCGEDM